LPDRAWDVLLVAAAALGAGGALLAGRRPEAVRRRIAARSYRKPRASAQRRAWTSPGWASALRRKSSITVAEPSGLLARRADAGIIGTMSRRRNAARGPEGRRMGYWVYDAVH